MCAVSWPAKYVHFLLTQYIWLSPTAAGIWEAKLQFGPWTTCRQVVKEQLGGRSPLEYDMNHSKF